MMKKVIYCERTQMSISIGGDHLKHAVIDGEKGHIKGSTSKIKDQDVLLAFLLVQTVGNGSGSSER